MDDIANWVKFTDPRTGETIAFIHKDERERVDELLSGRISALGWDERDALI